MSNSQLTKIIRGKIEKTINKKDKKKKEKYIYLKRIRTKSDTKIK
jgi:hypothetical protein